MTSRDVLVHSRRAGRMSQRIAISLLPVVLAISFSDNAQSQATEIPTRWPPSHPGEPYFPKGSLDSHPQSDSLRRGMYGQHLFVMQEPRLPSLTARPDAETIRFLWLRSFHAPVVVRLERRGAKCWVVTTVLDPSNSYEPGQISRRDSLRIELRTLQEVLDRLSAPDFWASREQPPGLDGATWLFEWVRPGQYQVVSRWSPEEVGREAAARDIGLQLLRLGRVEVPADEIY